MLTVRIAEPRKQLCRCDPDTSQAVRVEVEQLIVIHPEDVQIPVAGSANRAHIATISQRPYLVLFHPVVITAIRWYAGRRSEHQRPSGGLMPIRFCALFAVLATALFAASPAAAADTPFTVVGSVTDHSGTTIPFFTSSFTYNGTTYPYSMVGTNPFTSHATTTVPTEVTPVRFVFADGTVFDAGTVVRSAVRSPIWQAASFVSGDTQYGDAIQRAEFWSVIRHGYHVRLAQPTVTSTVTIDVPANQGTVEPAGATFGDHVALKRIGLVNISWFLGRYGHLINAEHVSAQTLPIILTHDVLLDGKTPDNGCCVGGFHSAVSTTSGNGSKKVQTAIFADYGSEKAIRRVSTNSNVFA